MKQKTANETFKDLTKGYSYVNPDVTEANFPIPKEVSIEGHRIISMEKPFSSEEAMERMKSEGCRPATIWELSLLRQEHPELWPMGQWSSFVAFGSAWKGADGHLRVPDVGAFAGGDFEFCLDVWGGDWGSGFCLVCFCDPQPLEAQALKSEVSPFDPSALTDEVAIAHLKSRGYRITREVTTTQEF